MTLQLSIFTKNDDTYAQLLPSTNIGGDYILRFVFAEENGNSPPIDFRPLDDVKTLLVTSKRCVVSGVFETPLQDGSAFVLSPVNVAIDVQEDVELNGDLARSNRRTMGGRRLP